MCIFCSVYCIHTILIWIVQVHTYIHVCAPSLFFFRTLCWLLFIMYVSESTEFSHFRTRESRLLFTYRRFLPPSSTHVQSKYWLNSRASSFHFMGWNFVKDGRSPWRKQKHTFLHRGRKKIFFFKIFPNPCLVLVPSAPFRLSVPPPPSLLNIFLANLSHYVCTIQCCHCARQYLFHFFSMGVSIIYSLFHFRPPSTEGDAFFEAACSRIFRGLLGDLICCWRIGKVGGVRGFLCCLACFEWGCWWFLPERDSEGLNLQKKRILIITSKSLAGPVLCHEPVKEDLEREYPRFVLALPLAGLWLRFLVPLVGTRAFSSIFVEKMRAGWHHPEPDTLLSLSQQSWRGAEFLPSINFVALFRYGSSSSSDRDSGAARCDGVRAKPMSRRNKQADAFRQMREWGMRIKAGGWAAGGLVVTPSVRWTEALIQV